MSPNSQWVVSGDVGGAIRVWGAKGDNVLKNEYRLWDGTVKEVSWGEESKRIVASGDGKEMRACALIWDTGSKTGEVAGHVKQVNSISFRNQRPFRVVTGSEDMAVSFHEGPPFKFMKSHTEHTNFVNCVRYSPDGNWVFSAGSDSKVMLYEGRSGDIVKEMARPDGISGSLWAGVWSPDSAKIVTAGGDKKLRIWDRESGAQVCEQLVGTGGLDDMQVGVCWPVEGRIISVCLDGRLLFWNVSAGGTLELASAVDGTMGPLSCLACDARSGALVHGGGEGAILVTPAGGPPRRTKVGKGVTHVVTHSASFEGPSEVWVTALDDAVRRISLDSGEVMGPPVEVKEFMVGAAWLDPSETRLVVVTGKAGLHSITSEGIEWSRPAAFPRRPTAVATFTGAPGTLAVSLEPPEGTTSGGVKNAQNDILLFGVDDPTTPDGISEKGVLEGHIAEVTSMRFSPSGDMLASADAGNKVFVWNLGAAPGSQLVAKFESHTARVTSLDWLPDGRIVSGSLDRHLYVWQADTPTSMLKITEAHKGGVSGVAVCGDKTFASIGNDGFLLVHQVP